MTVRRLFSFPVDDAKRSLRLCAMDTERAAALLLDLSEKSSSRRAADAAERRRRREQRLYGKTADGKRVDMELVEKLEQLGYTRHVAAEALRQKLNGAQDGTIITLHDSNDGMCECMKVTAETASVQLLTFLPAPFS